MDNYCLFCDRGDREKHKILMENDFCYAREDDFPVSDGHLEIVTKKHIVSFFDLSEDELHQIYSLLKQVKGLTDKKFHPDGYNIGLNEGEAAGRTIDHLHIHLIPRYKGDVNDSRGGIRTVIPGKGAY